MGPLALAAIMAGTGLLKSELVDRPREDRQRKLASETQRYSPWTHLQANPIKEANPFDSTLQGGAQGLSMGQGIETSNLENELMKKKIAAADKGIGLGENYNSPIGMENYAWQPKQKGWSVY